MQVLIAGGEAALLVEPLHNRQGLRQQRAIGWLYVGGKLEQRQREVALVIGAIRLRLRQPLPNLQAPLT